MTITSCNSATKMASNLEGKKIVIIGGTSGIGFAVAKAALLDRASEVVVASSTQSKVDNAVKRLADVVRSNNLPGKVQGEVLDGTDPNAIRQVFARIGELDHLVWTSGPGIADRKSIRETNLEEKRCKSHVFPSAP